MTPGRLAIACAAGFLTAVVGVITGANSLVTVPVLVMCGLAPRAAIATNMFAITFMTLAATLRFARAGLVELRGTGALFAVTCLTSAVGARLTIALSEAATRWVVGVSMSLMLGYLLLRPSFGERPGQTNPRRRMIGLGLAALLGVYGGLFSGGYTTLLTVVCVALFAMPLMAAVGLTKVVNLASSATATGLFALAGLVELRVAVPLAAAMAAGGLAGAELAITRGYRYVRAVFLIVVAALTVKLLVVDSLGWNPLGPRLH
jgi:uncharacterized membrane protein YfcA